MNIFTRFRFDCGDEVKDEITGFAGVIMCRTQWLANCNTYGLQSRKLKDGKKIDLEYFDEPHLAIVKPEAHEKHQDTGGPTASISRTNR